MYSLEKYKLDTLKLCNSLVIKLSHMAIAINKNLALTHGVTITDNLEEWKYYLNISGKKHWSNSKIILYVIETGKYQELTKELLETNVTTRAELLSGGKTYKELINRYPLDSLYIHGCMYPVDIKKAIEAEDGTILNYNSRYVEDNEYYLIPELEKHIKEFIHRWYLPEYMLADDLYPALFMGILAANLPVKTMNLRLDRVHTNNVHSFHLEHFFRSNFNIYDEITILNKPSIYWLYKNITNITKNIGSNYALNSLIENILTKNDIGIGTYKLMRPIPTLNNKAELLNSTVNIKPMFTQSIAKNRQYVINNNKVFSLDTTLRKEITYSEVNNFSNPMALEYIVKNTEDALRNNFRSDQPTKILELSTYQMFKQNGIDIFKFAIDNIAYGIYTNRINFLVNWVDPNTGISYLINAKMGLVLIIKLMGILINNKKLQIGKVYYDTILPPDKTILSRRYKWMLQDGYTHKIIKILEDIYPNNNLLFNSVTEFNKYLISVNNFYEFIWTIDSNSENVMVSAGIKQLMLKVVQSGYYDIADGEDSTDIDEILENNDINYKIYGDPEKDGIYDYNEAIRSLIKAITGLDINEYIFLNNINKNIQSLVNKLTSYTVHALTTDTGENSIFLKYNNIGLFNLGNPIISITGADFIPFNIYTPKLNVYSDNLTDLLNANVIDSLTYDIVEAKKIPVYGIMEYSNTNGVELVEDTYPTFIAQELRHNFICLSKIDYNIRITNVKLEFLTTEEEIKAKLRVSSVDDGYLANISGDGSIDIDVVEIPTTEKPEITADILEYISTLDGPDIIAHEIDIDK